MRGDEGQASLCQERGGEGQVNLCQEREGEGQAGLCKHGGEDRPVCENMGVRTGQSVLAWV